MRHIGKGIGTGLLVSALAFGSAMGQGLPKGPIQGQQGQTQTQGNQGQQTNIQAQVAQEMERAKARQAFQRGLVMARNAEQRLINLGESPDTIEILRQGATSGR